MDRTYDAVAAGHVCLDIIPAIPDTGAHGFGDLLRPGKLLHTGPVVVNTGGPVSNTGIALRKLGAGVLFCARTGGDAFGRITLDLLQRSGNADGVRLVEESASSYTIVLAPPGIDRVFLHNPGANDDFGPEDINPNLPAQARLFHFGYPPLMKRMYADGGLELERVFRIARDAGATTSCDMALPDPDSEAGQAPWGAILERVLPLVDIFLPSVEEALYMVDPGAFLAMKRAHAGAELIEHLTPDDYLRIADALLACGAGVVSLKSGGRGFFLKTADANRLHAFGAARPGDIEQWADRTLWGPALSAPNLASATGSGDSSIAGFLMAFLRGEAPETAVATANCVGWQNVQVLDAVSGIKSWEETRELMASAMPVNDAGVAQSGWRWDHTHRLWYGPGDPRY